VITINYGKIARKEMTDYVQEISNDNTVIVGKINPIVENFDVIIDLYLERRINRAVVSGGIHFKVFLDNTKCITGRVAIDSPNVIEKIKTCINKDKIIKAIAELDS
jgi:hypothetical protein